MSAGPLVVLDACVLANFSLCDTLLRLAEAPPLYEPRWSAEVILGRPRIAFRSRLFRCRPEVLQKLRE